MRRRGRPAWSISRAPARGPLSYAGFSVEFSINRYLDPFILTIFNPLELFRFPAIEDRREVALAERQRAISETLLEFAQLLAPKVGFGTGDTIRCAATNAVPG